MIPQRKEVLNKDSPIKQHFFRRLDSRFEEFFIVIGFLGFIALTVAQVLNRYLLPFLDIANITTWTEELARFIFVWISYLGASLSIKKREMIEVDLFTRVLPVSIKNALNIVNPLIMLYVSYVLISGGFDLVAMQSETSQVSPALQVSMAIPYLIVPLGFLLIALRLIQSLISDIESMNINDILVGIGCTVLIILPITLVPSEIAPAALLFGYFALFIIIGMPIAFTLGASTLATVIATNAIPIGYFSQTIFTSVNSFPLMAIPFFVAAGVIMGGGGLVKRLLRFADELVGFLPGGLAIVTIVTCMFFSAISGSGPATVAAIGTVMIPAMIKQGYNAGFATAIVAASGSIGVIIPPSNPFVIYGVVGEQSISKLFMAGITPGILVGVVLIVMAYLISKKNGWKGDKTSVNFKNVLSAGWNAKLAFLVPIIILGGIYGGIMTPTEAAAVAAAYGLVVSVWVYRDLNAKSVYQSLVKSGVTSSIIIILIAMATLFGRLITIEQVAEQVASFVLSISESKIIILLLINLMLLLVGVVMEAIAAIVILTPILLPIVVELGVDPVHFGIIMVLNLAIGFITPPVGVNLFVASGISKIKIDKIAIKILPLFAAMLFVLILTTYVPNLSLWLVHLLE